jgi:hypothetical protein
MKKALVFALCVVGFILIAAPTAVEFHPVLVNGKSIGNAVVVQGGIVAISLEDFAKAGGATVTLEPYFQKQGNRLIALQPPPVGGQTHKDKYTGAQTVKAPTQGKVVPAITNPWGTAPVDKQQGALKYSPGQVFRVQKAGEISSHLIIARDGKAFIPLDDVAKFFGGVYNQPNAIGGSGGAGQQRSLIDPADSKAAAMLKPGEAVQIDFRMNPNSSLVGQ